MTKLKLFEKVVSSLLKEVGRLNVLSKLGDFNFFQDFRGDSLRTRQASKRLNGKIFVEVFFRGFFEDY